VVVTADDPGMFSSQNEQDNRHYAKLGKFPMLEPADSQECKDFIVRGIEISEQFDTPVVVRTTMRTSHSKSVVELGGDPAQAGDVGPFTRNMQKYNCMCLWSKNDIRFWSSGCWIWPNLRRRIPTTLSVGGIGTWALLPAGSSMNMPGRYFQKPLF
jgi:hypothetical protein